MPMKTKAITAILLAGALSGCQSSPFFASIFGGQKSPATLRHPVDVAGAVTLEEGRAQLTQGNIAAAIASFRIARLDAATEADANNGLAVAYARLGRPDLAERYFIAALEIEPDNVRYTANLIRLRHDVMLASQRVIREQRAAAEAGAHREDLQRFAALGEAQPQMQPAAAVAEASPRATARSAVLHIATSGELGEAPAMVVASREAAPAPAEPPKAAVAQVETEADTDQLARPSVPQPLVIEVALQD